MNPGIRPDLVAEGVYRLSTGRGRWASNVYLVRTDPGWVLVDAGWPGQEEAIAVAAAQVFGPGVRPTAIVLTHVHPDHAGSAPGLARRWAVQVYVHAAELPQAQGKLLDEYANPLDRWVLRPMLRLLPARTVPESGLSNVVQALDKEAVPALPGWRAVPTPGHTPGHIALFREADGVLLTGDAVLTTDVNSVRGLLARTPRASGPPWIATWDGPEARVSIAGLARLRPRVIAAGHGDPVTGPSAARQLTDLTARYPAPQWAPEAPKEYRCVTAVRAGGPEVLEVVSRRLRAPRRGEARIRVESCLVSTVDAQARRGLSTYPPRFPYVPGYAVAGTVDRVGAGVRDVAPGDRVVVLTERGGYSEYVFVHRYPLMRIPASLDAGEVVAVALNYLVAHQVLSRAARIRRGQTVLVTGAAGGIGTALIQLGQLLDLTIYGVDVAAKRPWLASHGVLPLGGRGEDVVEELRRVEPTGVDAVLDGIGGEWMDHSLAVLRRGGVLAEYANPGSPAATLRLLRRAARYRLAHPGTRIPLYGTTAWRLDRRPLMAAWSTLYGLLGDRRINPVIAGRFPLSEARQAHTLLEQGGVVGSLVLTVAADSAT